MGVFTAISVIKDDDVERNHKVVCWKSYSLSSFIPKVVKSNGNMIGDKTAHEYTNKSRRSHDKVWSLA
jgi:hypothetical protein